MEAIDSSRRFSLDQKRQKSAVDVLEDELLLLIFKCLAYPALTTLSLVCRRWRALTEKEEFSLSVYRNLVKEMRRTLSPYFLLPDLGSSVASLWPEKTEYVSTTCRSEGGNDIFCQSSSSAGSVRLKFKIYKIKDLKKTSPLLLFNFHLQGYRFFSAPLKEIQLEIEEDQLPRQEKRLLQDTIEQVNKIIKNKQLEQTFKAIA